MQQVVETEATSNDEHQAFVKLCGNLKQNFVVVLKLKTIVLNIKNHSCLLLVEKLPDFKYVFEMLSSHFVEMPFQSA